MTHFLHPEMGGPLEAFDQTQRKASEGDVAAIQELPFVAAAYSEAAKAAFWKATCVPERFLGRGRNGLTQPLDAGTSFDAISP
jgi:hypothetical protein